MEIASSGSWSVGFMWAVGFLGVILGLFLICLVFFLTQVRNTRYDSLRWPALGATAFFFVVAVLIAGSLFPWSAEYHQYREVTGHVETVSARMVSTGESMEEKYVVRFEGSGQEFRVDDTRGALIEPGGALKIRCIKTWDYNATDGYVCKWGEFTP